MLKELVVFTQHVKLVSARLSVRTLGLRSLQPAVCPPVKEVSHRIPAPEHGEQPYQCLPFHRFCLSVLSVSLFLLTLHRLMREPIIAEITVDRSCISRFYVSMSTFLIPCLVITLNTAQADL